MSSSPSPSTSANVTLVVSFGSNPGRFEVGVVAKGVPGGNRLPPVTSVGLESVGLGLPTAVVVPVSGSLPTVVGGDVSRSFFVPQKVSFSTTMICPHF